MKMKTRLQKVIVLLLMLSMLAGTVGTSSIQAKEETKKSYHGEGYEITYIVQDEWQDGYNATIEIRNTGRKKIENWSITFQHPSKITNIWNAAIQNRENDFYTLKNAGWNQDIPAGDVVSFGITVSGKADELPGEYYLNGSIREVEKINYTVDIRKTDSWTDGGTNEQKYTGIVEITNLTENTMEDWELTIPMKDTLCDIWNAEMIARENSSYRIKGRDYNQNIEPGKTVAFGFIARGEGKDEPETYTLREIVTQKNGQTEGSGGKETPTAAPTQAPSEEPTQTPIDVPTETPDEGETEENELNEKTVCDYVNIDLKNGNAYNSVVDDVRFLNAAPDEIQVTWNISHPEIIAANGTVTRPEQDTKVNITAEILFEGKEYSKEFELNVKAQNSIRKEDIEDLSVSDLNRMNKEDEDYEVEINDYGYLESVSGQFSDVKVNSYESALYSLYSVKSAMGITDPFSELKPYDTKANENGYIFKFSQTYKGIPVYGSQVVVSSDTEGQTDSFLSDYYPVDENVELEPELSFEEAVEKIKTSYSDIDVVSETPQYYILNYYGQCDLVWEVCFYSNAGQNGLEQGEYKALIGAKDGEVKYLGSGTCSFSSRISAVGKDLQENARTFQIRKKWGIFSSTKYCLEDTKRNIIVYDSEGKDVDIGQKRIEKINSYWTPTEVSTISNMKDTYDYYFEQLNRISYNNAFFQMNGKEIPIYINTTLKDNAYWSRDLCYINIGSGTGGRYKEQSLAAGRDILGHEFTHAVINYETNLGKCYYGVTGAIDEGYADILGCYIDENWQYGEAVTKGLPQRDIENPLKTLNPIYVNGLQFQNYRNFEVTKDKGGVHNNSTIISHIAYLMQTESLKNRRIDKLWYESLCLGYSKHSDFYDVRKKVLKAAKRLLYTKNELKIIRKMFTDAGITKQKCNETYADYFKEADRHAGYNRANFASEVSLHGTVAEADSDNDNTNNVLLEDVDVTLMNQEQTKVLEETITDEDGEYDLSLDSEEEIHSVKFSLDGYLDEIMYIDSVNDPLQNECQSDMAELIPLSKDGNGMASGLIKDAVTGKGAGQTKLLLRKGINNRYTEVVDTFLTESDGTYQTSELPAGNYCLEIQGDNGITSHFNIKILGGEHITNQNGVLSPPMRADQMRVVLSWKESPVDLDLHMMCRLSDGKKSHVFFANEKDYIDKKIAFALDCDARKGYGPETITLYAPKTGDYVFYVNNFEEEAEMGGCGATVQIYFGDQTSPARTFYVPKTSGLNWEVFRYNSATNRIRVTNRMFDEEPEITDYWR